MGCSEGPFELALRRGHEGWADREKPAKENSGNSQRPSVEFTQPEFKAYLQQQNLENGLCPVDVL